MSNPFVSRYSTAPTNRTGSPSARAPTPQRRFTGPLAEDLRRMSMPADFVEREAIRQSIASGATVNGVPIADAYGDLEAPLNGQLTPAQIREFLRERKVTVGQRLTVVTRGSDGPVPWTGSLGVELVDSTGTHQGYMATWDLTDGNREWLNSGRGDHPLIPPEAGSVCFRFPFPDSVSYLKVTLQATVAGELYFHGQGRLMAVTTRTDWQTATIKAREADIAALQARVTAERQRAVSFVPAPGAPPSVQRAANIVAAAAPAAAAAAPAFVANVPTPATLAAGIRAAGVARNDDDDDDDEEDDGEMPGPGDFDLATVDTWRGLLVGIPGGNDSNTRAFRAQQRALTCQQMMTSIATAYHAAAASQGWPAAWVSGLQLCVKELFRRERWDAGLAEIAQYLIDCVRLVYAPEHVDKTKALNRYIGAAASDTVSRLFADPAVHKPARSEGGGGNGNGGKKRNRSRGRRGGGGGGGGNQQLQLGFHSGGQQNAGSNSNNGPRPPNRQ